MGHVIENGVTLITSIWKKGEGNYCFNSKIKEVKDTLKAFGDF